MFYKLTNHQLFYKIQQTRQAYAFWNAPDTTTNVFMLTPKGVFLGLPQVVTSKQPI
jgi:hypothetical protein